MKSTTRKIRAPQKNNLGFYGSCTKKYKTPAQAGTTRKKINSSRGLMHL